MYKDKKVGICDRYVHRNNRGILIIILISIVCLIYLLLKRKPETSSGEIDHELFMTNVVEQHREHCLNIFKTNNNEIDPNLPRWSKSFEDWFLYNNIFKKDGKDKYQNRTYLDIGGYIPFFDTASAFLDICLGWYGLCIWSPDLVVDKFSESDRSCNTINQECLWKADEKFHGGHDDSFWCKNPNRYIKDILNEYQFIDKFGNKLQLSNDDGDFKEIDFVALKIEGAEFSFLKCWPWDDIKVRVFMVGTIEVYEREIEKIMLANGYILYQILSFEQATPSMIFVKQNHDVINPWTEQSKHNFLPNYECTMIDPEAANDHLYE